MPSALPVVHCRAPSKMHGNTDLPYTQLTLCTCIQECVQLSKMHGSAVHMWSLSHSVPVHAWLSSHGGTECGGHHLMGAWGLHCHRWGLCTHVFTIAQGLWVCIVVVVWQPCGRLVVVVGGTVAVSLSLEPTVALLSSLQGHCAHVFILAHRFCGRVIAMRGFCGNLA